ncbi:MAG: HAMP domain-containing histidine kinase [Alistipes sp.]|nr:HAMP domain-containing histidine kinase [Alistipes sp.]
MNKSGFRAISMMVVFSLVLLAAVEAIWAVRTYRDMRESYEQQIRSVLEEAAWQYATNTINGNALINIGNISRFNALVGEGLRTSGLTTTYRVEVLSTTDADPIVIMAMGEEPASSSVLSVDKYLTPLILRLKVTDPRAEILASMRWILALQLLSVIVLAVTFIYLLRTLFRAKTLERIRRDLTHNITHELKTPVAAAYAATDILLNDTAISEDSDQRNEYLGMITSELRHLSTMIEEILRSSTEEYNRSSLRLEECALGDIVEECRASLSLKYNAREVVWNVDVAEDVALVADRFHLAGIVSALADNAIKYSPTNAEVEIKAEIEGDDIIISVADRGVGIARSVQRRIFDKFYRVSMGNRHDTKGYGLGLYYVKSIVESHGGSIDLTSTLGSGSRFRIKLPRYGK